MLLRISRRPDRELLGTSALRVTTPVPRGHSAPASDVAPGVKAYGRLPRGRARSVSRPDRLAVADGGVGESVGGDQDVDVLGHLVHGEGGEGHGLGEVDSAPGAWLR